MPIQDPAPQFIFDYEGSFYKGVKSDVDPSQLPPNYAWSGINLINVGGVLSCRPGQDCLVQFPDGNLQGAALFRPLVGLEEMVVAIDGVLYTAQFPFLEFSEIPNVQLSPDARQVYWALTTQSAERIDTTFTSAIRVREPRSVLFATDGGLTAPAWYDGSQSGHVRGNAFETPAGGPMVWVGDRLWVAVRNMVFASDIANPFSFREQIYLGGVSAFFFRSEVTAMVATPSIESPQLMVFTESDGSILEANIRDRNQWPSTADFQREIVQVGCRSNRSAFSHYGHLVWYSPSGVAFFDPALSGKITTRLPVRDNEMLVSKTTVSEDTSMIAGASFGQFFLMSVPAGDSYNKHTWVANNASLETIQDESGPSWCGHWIGTRPVEWVYGVIAGAERIYHVSVDVDGKNRLWQSFNPNRLDNNCPITWAFDTRGFFGVSSPATQKLPGARCRLCWADIGLAAIAEDIDLGVFYAGGSRGAYKPMLTKLIKVERGSLAYDEQIDINTSIFSFKPQSRKARTEDVNQQLTTVDTGSCGIELEDTENIDESFQLLVVGQGPASVRWIRVFGQTVAEDWSGDPNACTDETEFRALRFDGVGAESDTDSETLALLSSAKEPAFISNKTVVVDQGGFSAVGVGAAQSYISQQAADRVATIVATRQAENELRAVLPKIYSEGLE
jgi:hypothetical protein